MRNRFVSVAAGVVSLIALSAGAAAAQSKRPTVAVLDLDYGTVQRWWEGNWDIGKGVADMIVDGLVDDGSYRVIERKRLDAILAEQNFSNSDRADPSAASVAKLGKALGVKYLIVGSITKFGTENKDIKVGGGGWGGAGFGLGKVGTSKGKATVAITARMVDTTTGEIMASAKGEGDVQAQRTVARRRRRRLGRRRRRRPPDGLVRLPRDHPRRSHRSRRRAGGPEADRLEDATRNRPAVTPFDLGRPSAGHLRASRPASGRGARTMYLVEIRAVPVQLKLDTAEIWVAPGPSSGSG